MSQQGSSGAGERYKKIELLGRGSFGDVYRG